MEYVTTIGIDVSDRTSKICVMAKKPNGEREIVVETTCATTREGFAEALSKFDRSWPAVFETGTHCRWMDKCISKLGFRTIVANPVKIPSITKSNTKNDRNDARELARLAIADVGMLHPVKLRAEPYQQMLRLHHARNLLMSARVRTTNQIRGFAKSVGYRIEDCPTEKFHTLRAALWPDDVRECVWPLMDVLEKLTEKIKAYDAMIASLAKAPEFKEMVERVGEVYGLGILGSTVLVAVIGGDVGRFKHARDVGPYLGLVPKQDQSGQHDAQLHMTKAGSALARRVLVECAGVAMMSKSKPTDAKLKGLRIADRGGKNAKKRAKGAVARTLAVTAVALLMHPERPYVPLSEAGEKGFERHYAEMEYLASRKTGKGKRRAA